MRIVYDGIVFLNNHQRGIQRYFNELIERVRTAHDVGLWLRLPPVMEVPDGVTRIGPGRSRFPGKYDFVARARSSWNWKYEIAAVCQFEIFHSTFFTTPPSASMPSVVTVHDMIPEQFPDHFRNSSEHIQTKQKCMNQAQIILAISHATAKQILAFYPGFEEKVRVIHHGADHLPGQSNPSVSIGNCGSVLFVGDRSGYKNFRLLLEAMASKEWPLGLGLRVVGSPFSDAEQLFVQRMTLNSRITHVGRLSDDLIAEEYRKCRCFVFPSLEEGFGFPTLEAQAAGCAVACSDRPVFREIAGDAAEFFDPRLPESIALGISRAIERRDELIAAGLKNVETFRWENCARETIQAYMDALEISK